MDVSLLRRDVISNNVANSDTPNFKRSDVNFETALKNALESEKVRKLPARVSDSRHIRFNRPIDYRTVRPRQVLDYLTTSKNNGNNVDIEQESMNLLNNQLLYTLMTRAVSFQFTQISEVVKQA
jgi:flagellar basal-body rod protein FlgB